MNFNKLYIFAASLVITFSYSPTVWAQQNKQAIPPSADAEVADSPSQCISANDTKKLMAEIDRDRIPVAGCNIDIVAPKTTVQAYKRTLPGMNINGKHDCGLTRKNYFSSGYIDLFVQEFQERVNHNTKQSKTCAANMLYQWARANAMAEISMAEPHHITASQFARMAALSAISSKLFLEPDTLGHLESGRVNFKGKMKTRKEITNEWLENMALKVSGEIDGLIATHEINNRLYWQGYAILPVGLMTKNKKLIEKSEKVFLLGMNEIDSSRPNADDYGFMPKEIARKQRAVQYHVYSLRPLLGMALLSKTYNCDFAASTWRRSQLGYALRKTIEESYEDTVFPSEIRRATGSNVTLLPADGRRLLFMANSVDPLIYENVKSYLVRKKYVNANSAIFQKKYGPRKNDLFGAGENDIQLGGTYFDLAQAVRPLEAGKCPANIWQQK